MADERLQFDGPAGRLAALLTAPRGEPSGVAVVCHPHPRHGGTMDNKVVHTLSRAFVLAGLAALRFNFRGVGDSEGEYDHGEGEVGDVLAACEYMQGEYPGRPLWLAGFSFGAAMVLRAVQQRRPTGLVTVAPPVDGLAQLSPEAGIAWLLVQGEADEIVDAGSVLAWAQSRPMPPQVLQLPAVGHFFHGQLPRLREAVLDFIRQYAG
jgi:uncharacterized protein